MIVFLFLGCLFKFLSGGVVLVWFFFDFLGWVNSFKVCFKVIVKILFLVFKEW